MDTPKLNKKILVWVGAVIENSEGNILYLKRSSNSSWGVGQWQLPGGKLEWGEDPVTTLEREVAEETGIKAENQGLLETYTSHIIAKNTDYHAVQLMYKMKTKDTKVRISEEHDEFKWMSFEDARKYEYAVGHEKFIKR